MPARPLARASIACSSLLMLLLLVVPARPGLAAPREAPGTGVWLEVPDGFSPSSRFTGFENASGTAQIKVSLYPESFEQMTKQLSADALAGQGAVVEEETRLTVSGHQARLMKTVQMRDGKELHKWFLVVGSATRSVVVMAAYPEGSEAVLKEPLRKALVELSWDPSAPVDPLGGLSFRIGETDELKIAKRLDNGVLLTPGGEMKGLQPQDPVFVVLQSSTDPATLDESTLEAFALKRAKSKGAETEIREIVGGPTIVAEKPAYELLADVSHTRTKAPLRLYQVVVLGDDKVLLVQGLVGEARQDAYVTQFRALANGIRFVAVDAN